MATACGTRGASQVLHDVFFSTRFNCWRVRRMATALRESLEKFNIPATGRPHHTRDRHAQHQGLARLSQGHGDEGANTACTVEEASYWTNALMKKGCPRRPYQQKNRAFLASCFWTHWPPVPADTVFQVPWEVVAHAVSAIKGDTHHPACHSVTMHQRLIYLAKLSSCSAYPGMDVR